MTVVDQVLIGLVAGFFALGAGAWYATYILSGV